MFEGGKGRHALLEAHISGLFLSVRDKCSVLPDGCKLAMVLKNVESYWHKYVQHMKDNKLSVNGNVGICCQSLWVESTL